MALRICRLGTFLPFAKRYDWSVRRNDKSPRYAPNLPTARHRTFGRVFRFRFFKTVFRSRAFVSNRSAIAQRLLFLFGKNRGRSPILSENQGREVACGNRVRPCRTGNLGVEEEIFGFDARRRCGIFDEERFDTPARFGVSGFGEHRNRAEIRGNDSPRFRGIFVFQGRDFRKRSSRLKNEEHSMGRRIQGQLNGTVQPT